MTHHIYIIIIENKYSRSQYYNVLDDTISNQKKKTECCSFPDKLNDIKQSLDVFISTFCIISVSQAKISGLWLYGEFESSNNKNCSFYDILISEILPQTR